MTTILVVLMASPAAIAQTGSTNSLSEKQTPWPAPVGHRQPRMDQVPSEKDLNNPNSASNRDDAALDRKIKSICRGC
ncbi:MAG: hypothetical protein ACXWKP_13335 [Bradyrhizobium sp.]